MTKEIGTLPENEIPKSWHKCGQDYDRELLAHMKEAGYLKESGKDDWGRILYTVDPEILASVVHYVRHCERWRLICIGKLAGDE